MIREVALLRNKIISLVFAYNIEKPSTQTTISSYFNEIDILLKERKHGLEPGFQNTL